MAGGVVLDENTAWVGKRCIDNVMTTVYTDSMDTTLQVRIDSKTKAAARRAFKRAGVSFSGGLRLVLTHIGRAGELPVDLFTFDNLPETEKKAIAREVREAYAHGTRHKDVRSMLDATLGE